MSALRDDDELQKSLGYRFKDEDRLTEALTHSSFAHENPGLAGRDNERLEFLGDAVLGLAAARYLSELFPAAREGELSRIRAILVGEKWLATAAGHLDLGDFLRLGRGEDRSGGRRKRSILSGAVEALIGALFLDGGWDPSYRFAKELFSEVLASGEILGQATDAKTRLQEICQAQYQQTPHYRVLSRRGPSHRPSFTVAALLGEKVLAEGEGASKKEAEQAAAMTAVGRIDSAPGRPVPAGRGGGDEAGVGAVAPEEGDEGREGGRDF